MPNGGWGIGYGGKLYRATDRKPWGDTPPQNQSPTASFTTSANGLTVSVNAAASSDPDGSITNYAWSWGDGSTGSGVTANRTYASAGSYTITLTVTDNQSATGITTRSVSVTAPVTPPGNLTQLKVSTNGRYLTYDNGAPFVWQGDTAWRLPTIATPSNVTTYLNARKSQEFNVIQIVALWADWSGQSPLPNYAGHNPFNSGSVSSPNQSFWQHIDFIVNEAEQRNMYIALLPMWANTVGGHFISTSNAQAYGQFIGARYKNNKIIWVMGGDSDDYKAAVIRPLAKGIAIGVNGSENYSNIMMTFHPRAKASISNGSSSLVYHNDAWLDFNMAQSHVPAANYFGYDIVARDYALTPVKPAMESEPLYEGSNSVSPSPTPKMIRSLNYTPVLAGGFGFTYGHSAVWRLAPGGGGYASWTDALYHEAGTQMKYLRRLISSRLPARRIPDQSVVTTSTGSGYNRIQAGRDSSGTYAIVYTPGTNFTVNLDKLSGSTAQLWWYNPRTGATTNAGQVTSSGTRAMTTPDGNDWVFVMDDVAAGYSAPGQ